MARVQVAIYIPVKYDRSFMQTSLQALVRSNNEAFDGAPEGRQSRTAAPTGGTYKRGHIIWNSEPSATGYVGWVCVTGGEPGTWKGFGTIEA